MEKELEELNVAIDNVMNCNLDEKTKEFVLSELKKRLFDLKTEISRVENNEKIVFNK